MDRRQAADPARRLRRRWLRAAALLAGVMAMVPAARGAAAAPAAAADTEPLVPGPRTNEPLAGISGDTTFLRSANNLFVLFPSARLQVDGAFFSTQSVKSGFSLKRVRLELSGWIGPGVFYNISGDFASPPPGPADPVTQSFLATTDDYVALAPLGDIAILQVGQFDAPFTLENRISDRYTDFIERSLVVRSIGAPTNKEVGLMLHGTDDRRRFYYSAGLFNGEGANFRNVDNQFDLIGRAFIAPLGLAGIERGQAITVGGSFWRGRHLGGVAFSEQTTAGGFRFFNPRWTIGRGDPTTLELHQQGRMYAYALELDAPLTHRLGLRAEYIFRHQQLTEDDISAAATSTVRTVGNATLDALGGYAEAWFWVVGDDQLLPRPGMELPIRLASVLDGVASDGLMLVARGEFLKEDMRTDNQTIADPNTATTRVIAASIGANYWYSKRFRFSANYTLNIFRGTSEGIRVVSATTPYLHEFLLRLAVAL